MKTILKYDKVILVKELNEKFKKVGEVFEISSILEDSFLLRDERTRVDIGIVSFEDFENHFVPEENYKGWTSWTQIIGFNGQNDVFYKTNRRKVIVKFLTDKVSGESACHRDDEFNLAYGIQIGYIRALNKALYKKKNEYESKLKMINSEIADNENILKKMINSLNR